MKSSSKCLEYQSLDSLSFLSTEPKKSQSKFWMILQKLRQSLNNYFNLSLEIRVWQKCDRYGQIWWSAYNPKTQQSVHHIGEEQMRDWIEQSYR